MTVPEAVCNEPDVDKPGGICLAAEAGSGRCLAHLDADGRAAYLATLAPGSDVDATGVAFTSYLLIQLLDTLRDDHGVAQVGNGTFESATFSEFASFDGVTFTGEARFERATFSEFASFDGVTFTGEARFERATFSEFASFDGATFSGDAIFERATFSENVGFNRARFSRDARFGYTTFSSVVFAPTTFSGLAAFEGTTFSGAAHIGGRAETLRLIGAVFESDLDVRLAARVVFAPEIRAAGRVSLRLRAARVDLSDAVCVGPLTVHALQQPIAGVDESGLLPQVLVASLRRVDAASLVLTDVDLSRCAFAGLHRADQVHLDGRCTFATDPRRRRRVLAEEHYWRARQRVGSGRRPGRWAPAPEGVELVQPPRLEVLYRQLRKALEDAKNEPGAADFYYGEMEMRRARARGGERVLLWLYWLVSGYGLRAGRALAALAVVVAALAVGMRYTGFPGRPVPYLDALLYSLRSTVAVDVKSPAVPEAVTRWGQVFRILLRITGPLFVGLAALAIRNRVKR